MPAAFFKHRLQRRQIDCVLAFVVGGPSAIPKFPAFGQRPGSETRRPLSLETADGVAVSIGKDGRRGWVLKPFCRQDRTEPLARIRMDRHGEAKPLEPGLDGLRK